MLSNPKWFSIDTRIVQREAWHARLRALATGIDFRGLRVRAGGRIARRGV